MTADRNPPTISTNPSGIGGSTYATRIAEEITAVYNGRVNQVTSVAGTNTITGVCTPPLLVSPVHGATFRLTPVANNTGAVTVNIDSKGAIDLRSEDNAALAADDIISGLPIEFWYDSTIGDYRLSNKLISKIASDLADEISAAAVYEAIGYTLITGSPVAAIEHTFTAGLYSYIRVVAAGISTANSSNTLTCQLRSSGANAVSSTVGAAALNNSAFTTVTFEFLIDKINATGRFAASVWGIENWTTTGTTTAHTVTGDDQAVSPDRIRFTCTSGNLDAGELFTYGIRA